jgi:hypothetical protein
MIVRMRSESRLWLCECGQSQGYGCLDEIRDKALVVWMRSENRLKVV